MKNTERNRNNGYNIASNILRYGDLTEKEGLDSARYYTVDFTEMNSCVKRIEIPSIDEIMCDEIQPLLEVNNIIDSLILVKDYCEQAIYQNKTTFIKYNNEILRDSLSYDWNQRFNDKILVEAVTNIDTLHDWAYKTFKHFNI